MYKIILSYLVISPISDIAYLLWIKSMEDYKWLFISVIMPIFNIIGFAPSLINNTIFLEISQKKIFLLALLEYISHFLFIISITNISYFVSLIIGKSSLIIIMICSYIFLGKIYFNNHYIGVIIILLGILLSLVKKVNNENTSLIYILVNLCSVIANCFSYIYQEKYIKIYKNINTFVINFWINIWRLVIGIILFPLIFIPFKDIHVSSNNIASYLNDGFECQFINNCKQSIILGIINIFLYVLSINLMYIIFLQGSSLIYKILSLLKTPLTICLLYILINYNIITSEQQYNFTIYDYFGIVFIILGSFIYLSYPEKDDLSYNLLENNIDNDELSYNLLENNIDNDEELYIIH
jgi:drug/metabolite transporter (DMT)-like permease